MRERGKKRTAVCIVLVLLTVFLSACVGSVQPADELEMLVARENEIIAAENELSRREWVFEHDGNKIQQDVFSTYVAQFQDVEPEKYDEAFACFSVARKQKSDAFAVLMIELIQNRNRQAVLRGYADYADFMNQTEFHREYLDDLPALYELMKAHGGKSYGGLIPANSFTGRTTLAARLDDVEFGRYDQLFSRVFDVLTTFNPYTEEAANSLLSGGRFTHNIQSQYSRFSFVSAENDIIKMEINANTDFNFLSLLAHESGHYTNACIRNRVPRSVEIAETQSMFTEFLTAYSAELLVGDAPTMIHNGEEIELPPSFAADFYRYGILYNLFTYIIRNCMAFEFENRLYSAQNLTADTLPEMYGNILGEYGAVPLIYTGAYEYLNGYDWMGHSTNLMNSSFYLISYTVAGLNVFNLWDFTEGDYPAAVARYQEVIAYDDAQKSLTDFTEHFGLPDIFGESAFEFFPTMYERYRVLSMEIAQVLFS
jgi:hypothetical protein